LGLRGRASWQNIVASWFAFISLLLISSCATLFNSGDPAVAFSSDPEGAQIKVEPQNSRCTTPCTLVLNKKSDHWASASLDGSEAEQKHLARSVTPSFWLNLLGLIYGVIGMGVDWATGDMWTLPTNIHFDLVNEDTDDEDEQEATVVDEPSSQQKYSRIPDSPELLAMKLKFKESYIARQVRYYYGKLKVQEKWHAVDRIYLILMEMERKGERLDPDEAVRRDHFNQSGM
jgi:hypothetical protein